MGRMTKNNYFFYVLLFSEVELLVSLCASTTVREYRLARCIYCVFRLYEEHNNADKVGSGSHHMEAVVCLGTIAIYNCCLKETQEVLMT